MFRFLLNGSFVALCCFGSPVAAQQVVCSTLESIDCPDIIVPPIPSSCEEIGNCVNQGPGLAFPVCPNGASEHRDKSGTFQAVRAAFPGESGRSAYTGGGGVVCSEFRACDRGKNCKILTDDQGNFIDFRCNSDAAATWQTHTLFPTYSNAGVACSVSPF